MLMKCWRLIFLFVIQTALVSCAAERDLRTAIMVGLMGEGGGDRMFYYPTKDLGKTPDKYGCKYQDVYFEAEDGVKLHAWWLPAKGESKGTIVYSHGNAGSVGHHVVFIYWLVDAGYNVLMYDYRGYGQSEGKVTKVGAVKDAQAAFRYVESRDDAGSIISLGHSLGGAKSIAALGVAAPKNLKAVVVDSTFASYQDMAERVAGKRARKVITATYEPYEYVKKIPRGVPFLIVHGAADETIPFTHAQRLYAVANQPKTMMKVEGGNHVNCFFVQDGKYRKELLAWLAGVLDK